MCLCPRPAHVHPANLRACVHTSALVYVSANAFVHALYSPVSRSVISEDFKASEL